jgi:hypothetical protein
MIKKKWYMLFAMLIFLTGPAAGWAQKAPAPAKPVLKASIRARPNARCPNPHWWLDEVEKKGGDQTERYPVIAGQPPSSRRPGQEWPMFLFVTTYRRVNTAEHHHGPALFPAIRLGQRDLLLSVDPGSARGEGGIYET